MTIYIDLRLKSTHWFQCKSIYMVKSGNYAWLYIDIFVNKKNYTMKLQCSSIQCTFIHWFSIKMASKSWKNQCIDNQIPHSDHYPFTYILLLFSVFIALITCFSIFFSICTTLIISFWFIDWFADIMEQYIALVVSFEITFGLFGSWV